MHGEYKVPGGKLVVVDLDVVGSVVGVEPFADPAVKGEGGPVLASAVIGGDAGRPVILATRIGKGVVVRFPIPGMAARLSSDTELTQLLRNTWILLSR